MPRLLKIIYLCSTVPLLTGSATFFYWFYKRKWFADNLDIELFAFYVIIGFLLITLVAIILCIVFVVNKRSDWKKLIIPIVIVGITVPLIDLYGTLYASLSDKAFVRIINDTDMQINRIWSDNFEMTKFENKQNDFVITFYPIYTYDWETDNSLGFNYNINTVHIDLKQKQKDSILTYNLPEFSKGDCATIKISDVINEK